MLNRLAGRDLLAETIGESGDVSNTPRGGYQVLA
jgi:hypothetical protein